MECQSYILKLPANMDVGLELWLEKTFPEQKVLRLSYPVGDVKHLGLFFDSISKASCFFSMECVVVVNLKLYLKKDKWEEMAVLISYIQHVPNLVFVLLLPSDDMDLSECFERRLVSLLCLKSISLPPPTFEDIINKLKQRVSINEEDECFLRSKYESESFGYEVITLIADLKIDIHSIFEGCANGRGTFGYR